MALEKAMTNIASVDDYNMELELDAVSIVSTSSADNIASLTNMEARMSDVEARCRVLEITVEQMAQICLKKKSNKQKNSKAVKQRDLEQFIREAVIKGCGDFGVSKPYIRKYIKEKCNIEDTRHIRKRLNKILKDNICKQLIKLDDTIPFYTAL